MTKRHVDIDDDLLNQVQAYYGTKTIKETVNEALRGITAMLERRKAVERWLTDPNPDARQLEAMTKNMRQELAIWRTRVRSSGSTSSPYRPSSCHCSTTESSPPVQ